jgi:flagellar biogenesis protein FliO
MPIVCSFFFIIATIFCMAYIVVRFVAWRKFAKKSDKS